MHTLDHLTSVLAGRYRIERQLGQGGMATVYLAEDVKHKRKVALKVLKPELAAVLGADRFVQEITTTAALQHPHILPLFDSGEADGVLYYVMPFIDGETLRAKLNRETQLGIDEAIKISTAVADALHYAHRHGVIHRDIKPENILLHDGQPMVADFGIALAVSAAAGGRMTETGLSLGTPHYMSPEQATAEKEITGRSDIYSLASVLYEMLAGNPPHVGSSAQQIIMKIIAEPVEPVTKYRRSVPPNVAAAVATALEKLPADRFESAAAFAAALSNSTYGTASMRHAAQAQRSGGWRERAAIPLLALVLPLLALAVWGWFRPVDTEMPVGRFEIVVPGTSVSGVGYGSVAMSPDGRSIVFQDASEGLFLRRRGELDAKLIAGIRIANGPFFSPDGASVGYVTGFPGSLMVAPVAGGAPRVIVRDSATGFGSVWGRDGNIYYTSARGALMRVSAAGGTPLLLARPDSARGDHQLTAPDLLPGDDAALVTVYGSGPPQIGVADFSTGTTRLLAAGSVARFGAPDYLLIGRESGDLIAVPFDARRRVTTGPEIELGDRLKIASGGVTVSFAITDRGEIIYVAGSQQRGTVERVDRNGRPSPVDPDWNEVFSGLALSPDGRRLALSKFVQGHDEVWVKTLDQGPLTRVSFGGILSYRPSWSPDGRTITFVSDREGTNGSVYGISATGGRSAERLYSSAATIDEALWSSDGRWLVYRAGSGGGRDILAHKWGTKDPPIPIATSEFEERAPALSPDNRFVAYVSDESGRTEVYVRPFPDASSAKIPVSRRGGTEPRWSHSGRELFYRSEAGDLMAVQLGPGPGFTITGERALFSTKDYQSDNMHKMYEVLRNDQSFLFIRAEDAAAGKLIMVQNWRRAVEQRRGRQP